MNRMSSSLGEIMRRIQLRAKPKYEISFRYTSLLNTQHYTVWIKGKMERPR